MTADGIRQKDGPLRTLVAMRTSRLRITLRDVAPAVVRVVDVPVAATLPEVHRLLQAAMGWTDSHLHRFVADGASYGQPDELDDDLRDEAGAGLRELPAAFTYLYDLGDGWEHDVEVMGPGDAEPGCRYGEGACPPEDCGGPPGYAELLTGRLHDATEFDQAATDLLVRRTVGAVPDSVRLVLDLARDGVRLTPGGRLPRVVVRQVQEQRPGWHPLGRPASIEEDLLPLLVLHDVLRQVGLLRLNKGVVRPIRAASDDLEVVRRLRRCFSGDEFSALLADLTVASLVAEGPQRSSALASRVHPMLGRGWAFEGAPLTVDDVHHALLRLGALLEGLDLATCGRDWCAGPSALVLFPRATALAARQTALSAAAGAPTHR